MANTDTTMNPVKRFFMLLSQDKVEVGYIYLYAIFNGLINLTLPLGIQAILVLITGQQTSTSWVILIAIVILGVIFSGGLQIMQLTITENLQRKIFTRSAFEFAYRIPRIKLEAVQGKYLPELINRFFDTLSVQKGVSKILIDFSTSVLQIVFGLLLLSFYHPLFIFFGFFLIAMLLFIFRLTGPRGLRTSLLESKYKYEVAHWLEELARVLQTFKLAGETDLPIKKTDKLTSLYLDARKKHFSVLVWQYANVVGFKTLVTAALLILGSLLVINQEINIGQFVASEIIIILIINSVEKLILSMDTIYDVLTSLEKLGNVTDLPLENRSGIDFEKISNGKNMDIKIHDLSYSYETQASAIKNVNLHIKAGEKVCVTGYSGSGKATLLQVISGLYQNFEGSVVFNDVPMNNLNITTLRSKIGDNLFQENLFFGTLEENIRMGREWVTFNDVIEVSKGLQLSEFIRSCKQGFDTVINPVGKSLPKSIMKKILLARSIVGHPELILLEDSFLNVDKESRLMLQKYITGASGDFTLIIVSNDAEFAIQCDRVIVMDNGSIIDDGPYEEIIKDAKVKQIFNLK